MSPPAAKKDRATLDPHVWRAFAGASGKVPSVGSLVYYFPQGHAEQAFSPPDFSSVVPAVRAYFLCRVTAVRLLSSGETDEVFARIDLDPRVGPSPVSSSVGSPESTVEEPEEGIAGGASASVRWFPKVLTPSDANNGGGFSVPRFCAENVFPKLDTAVGDPPVQMLAVRDVHGVTWHFKHIFRGTPRRHLLTTGWSKFVNRKKIVAGDSVVFARSRDGELFVGLRRSLRAGGSGGAPTTISYTSPTTGTEIKMEESSFLKEGYWRSVKGRIPGQSVVESVNRAQLGFPFEVVYYPSVGSPEFLVSASAVEDAMFQHWAVGLRVRMGVESEDLLRTTWFQGTISCISFAEQGLWSLSPWGALQVTWDEPDAMSHVKSVNPWQVESLSSIAQVQSPYPSRKKSRFPQATELLGDGGNNLLFPLTRVNNIEVGGNLTTPFVGPTFSPAGMQGARHDSFGVSSLLKLEMPDSYRARNFIDISTELNLGNSSQFGSSSVIGRRTPQLCGVEDFDRGLCTDKNTTSSFRLFGQTIQLEQSVSADDHAGNKVDEKNEDVWSKSEFSHKRKQTLEEDGIEFHVFVTEGV